MKIDDHISELLFEHDCVIVPDFGGFVCNYAPAQIDPVKHLFEPPGKRILFNKGLTRNDGLLAHHISGKYKLPYSDALNSISEEVKRYKDEIEQDKRLTLENIGLLYADENGTLLFQQDNKLNYLADSFGLAPFYHLPSENVRTEAEAKLIPIHNERKRVRLITYAAVIAALAISGYFFTLMEKQTNMRFFSSFEFFSKKVPAQYVFSSGRYKELPGPVFNANDVPHVFVTGADTKVAVTATINNPVPASAKAKVDVTKTVPVNDNTATLAHGTFTIIIGSFGVKENAEKLIHEFAKQNLQVSIVGKNPAGLYMVGYGSYKSHDDAISERVSFMKKYSKDAWVKGN